MQKYLADERLNVNNLKAYYHGLSLDVFGYGVNTDIN